MKTITLILAAAAITFAQTPAAPAPAKEGTTASDSTTPVKKHTKKHSKKTADTTKQATPPAAK